MSAQAADSHHEIAGNSGNAPGIASHSYAPPFPALPNTQAAQRPRPRHGGAGRLQTLPIPAVGSKAARWTLACRDSPQYRVSMIKPVSRARFLGYMDVSSLPRIYRVRLRLYVRSRGVVMAAHQLEDQIKLADEQMLLHTPLWLAWDTPYRLQVLLHDRGLVSCQVTTCSSSRYK